jgi:hypothetical protein
VAEISADTSKFEQGTKKTKTALDQQAAAFAKFSADATRNAKSYLSYESQKAKAIAATERQAAKLAREEEKAAKAAARAAEIARKNSLVALPGLEKGVARTKEWAAANAGLLTSVTAVAGGIIALGAVLNKTIDGVVEYGDQVQKLKTITGQSAEATSNTIQLADDARVSYEKLAISLQFASKKGVDTSITGLAKLSEQYKALAPGIERTKFLTDTFGKSGVDMAKILEMDSKAIRDFKANAGQILTEADLRDIKAYNAALDSLKDGFEGFSNTVGKSAMPWKTTVLNGINVYIRAIEIAKEQHVGFSEATDIAGREIWQEQQAMIAAGDAAEGTGDSLDDLAETQQAAEESARKLSNVYTGLLSSMFSIQKGNEQFAQTMDDLTKKDAELAAEKDKLTLKMWEEQAAGKLTNDENLRYIEQLAEITNAQEENAKAKESAEEDAKKATEQRVYDLTQQKLAADGVINSGEFEYLQNLAVSHGLASKAAADQAIAENKRADQLVSNFARTQPTMETTLSTMQQIAGYNGTVVNFGVNFQTTGSVPGMGGVSVPGGLPAGSGTRPRSRDNGGAGIAGEPYMIGTPEIFVPKTDGNFIPLHGADKKVTGDTIYNIIINNPKKETSENSIRKSLKNLSYIGVAA